tara:strand:+ start:1549 stop:1764 length:216 start_codon:yes stop_codon:yes gene_type:complete
MTMHDSNECVDGVCPVSFAPAPVAPGGIFFAPIEEPEVKEPKAPKGVDLRKKFLDYCEEYPYDIECKIYEV